MNQHRFRHSPVTPVIFSIAAVAFWIMTAIMFTIAAPMAMFKVILAIMFTAAAIWAVNSAYVIVTSHAININLSLLRSIVIPCAGINGVTVENKKVIIATADGKRHKIRLSGMHHEDREKFKQLMQQFGTGQPNLG